MLRVSYVEDDGRGQTDYETVLCNASDTPFQILASHSVNPETRNIYLNGRYIAKKKLEQPFSVLVGRVNMIFLTVRCKN